MNTFDIQGDYRTLHQQLPITSTKPVIGITGNYQNGAALLNEGYILSVLRAGGTPLIIPPHEDIEALLSVLETIDALILSGGADVNPLFLGEEPSKQLSNINPQRDWQELMLCQLAMNRQIPILGICRGMQVLNLAMGGTVWQDIYSGTNKELLKHSQDLDKRYASHSVSIEEGSVLSQLFHHSTQLFVNSFHHQAVKDVAHGFKVTATAPDGIIEAMESTEYKSVIGVQWHPECFIQREDTSMMPLFHWLVEEARLSARVKAFHKESIILDSHCDTPMFFHQQIDFSTRDARIKYDLHKMREGRVNTVFMVAYLPQKERDDASLHQATADAQALLAGIDDMVARCGGMVELAQSVEDIYRLKKMGKKAIVKGIENGYAIGKDLSLLQRFQEQGVAYITLCHNGNNDICGSARYNEEGIGLTDFGQKVVKEMNRIGLLIDLSHAGERTFYDVLEASSMPVVCTHSSCRALCDHPRNLTDEQLQAIAQKGGVVQVCMYSGFLRSEGMTTVKDVADHIDHLVQIMGIDHVGIGSDFDGDGGVTGCNDASEMPFLTRELMLRGYNNADLQKIWGENFLRVLRQVQNAPPSSFS